MRIALAIIGIVFTLLVLWDAFETIVLPRRVSRKFRWATLLRQSTWRPWLAIADCLMNPKRRETLLSIYGPLLLLQLLTTWALALVLSFALLHWAAGPQPLAAGGYGEFATALYFSGTTFFTLGLGDVLPRTAVERVVTVAEGGLGFGFLALVIGYLPVIYQAFSRREVNISLLDARAGSPPTAAELLRRHTHDHGMEALRQLLYDWEHWAAELMESHLSYPVLAQFRSQHKNESWLGALTAILDTSALVIAGIDGACSRQAELTFAIARHAVVDLAQVFATPRCTHEIDRLPPAELERLRRHLAEAGLRLREGSEADRRLSELRRMYEPYVQALAEALAIALPPWFIESPRKDNWQTSAWEKALKAQDVPAKVSAREEHF